MAFLKHQQPTWQTSLFLLNFASKRTTFTRRCRQFSRFLKSACKSSVQTLSTSCLWLPFACKRETKVASKDNWHPPCKVNPHLESPPINAVWGSNVEVPQQLRNSRNSHCSRSIMTPFFFLSMCQLAQLKIRCIQQRDLVRKETTRTTSCLRENEKITNTSKHLQQIYCIAE